ncbi:MAG: PRC-barrel domain-containing protein [Rhodospirillales bacterium]|nr:PRC-barrel domain-containing protein [Rhodospirillales bacterium]
MPNHSKLLAAALLSLGTALAAPIPAALAHSGAHPVMWQTTHLVGTPVYNDQHQKIGTISDVLVSPNGTTTEAVLSIGAFVGGNKRVAVPMAHLSAMGHDMMMHGATKAMLEALPVYLGGGNG